MIFGRLFIGDDASKFGKFVFHWQDVIVVDFEHNRSFIVKMGVLCRNMCCISSYISGGVVMCDGLCFVDDCPR